MHLKLFVKLLYYYMYMLMCILSFAFLWMAEVE